MVPTSSHMGSQLPGLTNRNLKTSWFLTNSPARSNISTGYSTRWIVTAISLSNRIQYMLDCYCYVPVQQDTVHAGLLLLCPCPTGYSTRWIVTTMSLSNRIQYTLDCYCYVPVQQDTVHAGLLLICPCQTGYSTRWIVTSMSLSNMIQYTLDCY